MVYGHQIRNKVHIAVIGGNGFIGRNLIRRLANQPNLRIWSLDRRYNNVVIDTEGYEAIVQQVHMNLLNETNVAAFLAAQPIDIVIYLAGFEAPTDGLGDLDSDAKSIQAAINTFNAYINLPVSGDVVRPYFLYVSSWSVYGENNIEYSKEEDLLVPANFTGMGKLYIEDTMQKVLGVLGVPWCILRPTEVYGRRHHKEYRKKNYWAGYLHYYLDKIVRREKEIDVFSPNTEIDLIHVNYLTKVIVDCMVEMRQGIYNVSSGETIKIFDLAQKIQRIYGEEYSKLVPTHKLRIENMTIDSSKVQELVPYEPERYPLDKFIEQYIPVRRLEVAHDMCIEQILTEPKILDTTPFNAKDLFEKRQAKRAIDYAAIKEVAGDQFKYLRYGRFQERAQELLGFNKSESKLPKSEQALTTREAIDRVKEIFKLSEDPLPTSFSGRLPSK